MKSLYKEISGGLRAGLYNVTFPFAKLKISSNDIIIIAPCLNTIQLSAAQVIKLDRYKSILGKGYAIYHNAIEYPTPLIFWGNPNKIEQIIKEVGFIYCEIGTVDISQITSQKIISIIFSMLIGFIVIIGILIMLLS